MKAKTILVLLSALFINLFVGGALAFASGLNPVAIIGGGMALSMFMPAMGGIAPMAIQKEIWLSSIVEGLFAENSFVSKAFNADMFVNAGKIVHIPNAGAGSGVSKNRTQFPATVTTRNDVDLYFALDEYTTNPIRIPHADTVELSYDKRESVIRTDRNTLIEHVANSFIGYWSPASTQVIRTTGESAPAHVPSATGVRTLLRKADISAAALQFNKDDVPSEGRYMLIDAVMYQQLLDDMTDKDSMAFHASADVKNGVVGKLYGFNIMMRSKAGRYATNLTSKDWTAAGATTDHGAVLAWHIDSVCRALGEVNMFDNVSDPTYYGDIYSFLVRAGGRPMRDDVKGLLAIVQAAYVAPAG